jgi:endonuclease G
MVARRKTKKRNSDFFGIQLNKWALALLFGIFLFLVYEGNLLKDVLKVSKQILLEELGIKEQKDKKRDEKQKDKEKQEDDSPIREDNDQINVTYDPSRFNPNQIKDLEFPSSLVSCQLIRHTHYSLCYSEKHEQALWVAYILTYNELFKDADRSDDSFIPDDKVSTKTALPNDYATSGYDRGHLAPAADFSFSESALAETFYMSNISPQVPDFNRGIWNELEQRVRFWVKKEKSLYIVTGGVLYNNNQLKKIGRRTKISVPTHFYKIIVDLQLPEIKAIAFLMENQASEKSLQSYVVSIDEIENLTGLDFFPKLPDELEKPLEASISIGKWFKTRR